MGGNKIMMKEVQYFVTKYFTGEKISGPFNFVYQALNWIDENLNDQNCEGIYIHCEFKKEGLI